MVGLNIKQASFAYNGRLVLENIDLTVSPGEMVGLLGPNGSGKTTLIKLASGILKPGQGEIWLDGSSMGRLSRKEIARRIAVMPQRFHIPFAFTVGEVVMLGRIPFIRMLAGEKRADREAVSHALEIVDIAGLEGRRFDELSGGERQKVILAMVLAQQPQLLLLDEPTAHLDIAHQVEILEMVRGLNRGQGLTVVAAMHDLNMASLYFDRLILLKEGSVLADGSPSEVITEDMLRKVFSALVRIERHPAIGAPHVVIMPGHEADG